MNDLNEQIDRECLSRTRAQEKLKKDTSINELNANASNNFYGVQLMRDYLGMMI